MISDTQTQSANMKGQLVRATDISIAVLLIMGAAPVLVSKYLYRKCRYATAIEKVYIHDTSGGKIALYQFSGEGICCRWPYLLNLLRGELSLVGSEKQYYLEAQTKEQVQSQCNKHTTQRKPGLLSFEQMHQTMGINFESQQGLLQGSQNSIASYLMAAIRIVIASIFSSPKADTSSPEIPLFELQLSNISMDDMLSNFMQQSVMYKACQTKIDPRATSQHSVGMVQYAFVNADCLNMSVNDPFYRRCLQHSCHKVFADGSGIRIASLWKGFSPKDNLNGTDMFPRLCEQVAENNLSIFLLGGAPGIAAKTAENMQHKYPKLTIAGTHHGYFDSVENEQAVIAQINASGASILLVAMGAPKQEIWLEKHQPVLNVAVGIGVGGLFDFYSEKIIRAPLWVRQIGMEWVCRLAEEPKRMWKRYILGNPLFLYRVWREIAKEKQQSNTQANAATAPKQAGNTPSMDNSLAHFGNNATQNSQATQRCKRRRAAARLNLSLKRGLDLTCASILLFILLPLLIAVALLIRLESKGPVLFNQQRAGKDNIPFTMWKFRSMYQDAEQRLSKLQSANEMQGGVLFKMKQDPRITLVGKIIRKLSIDELPQLWNVISGDMSLVGPRPALLTEVKLYSVQDRRRLAVKPGITCIWQVSGRSNIPFDKQVELDVDYIYQQSFLTDIWLLIKTIPAVILARGAY